MRNVMIVLLLLTLVVPASAAIFGRADDCTCTIRQPATMLNYAAPQWNTPSQPTAAALATVFPTANATEKAALTLTDHVAPYKSANAIQGPAKLTKAEDDAFYTILALPRHYKTCASCMRLNQAFSTDAKLVAARRESRFLRLVDGDPQFTAAWHKVLPEVRRGRTMVALVECRQGKTTILGRWTAPTQENYGPILDKLREKRAEHLKKLLGLCPTPEPIDEPEPVDEPDDEYPVIPPMTPTVPPLEADKGPNGLVVAAFALLGAVAGWGLIFSRGSR